MERPLTRASLEAAVVRSCAATLLGAKPANMFTFAGRFAEPCDACAEPPAACAVPVASGEVGRLRRQLRTLVTELDAALAPTGVRVTVLAWRPFGAIVYVYRPRLLAAHLRDHRIEALLGALGYPADAAPAVSSSYSRQPVGQSLADQPFVDRSLALFRRIAHLRRRFAVEPVPHEIGFFLGYPPEDVLGFIEHEGRDYRCLGCWKVYGDVRAAQRSFARYRRCARRCQRLYRAGASLADLARQPRGIATAGR